MVNKILAASGIAYRRGRFTVHPAPDTYAVYMDDVTTDGPDGEPQLLRRHDVTVEVYMNQQDDTALAALEAEIAAAGLHYTKQDLYWLQSEQLYQVIYEFTYFEKGRI